MKLRNLPIIGVLVGALLLAALSPAPARAITGGAPDGNTHPYVALIYDNHALCTGTLIAPTVVLTAGHCTTSFANDGSPVYVTFDADPGSGSAAYPATPYTDPDYVPVQLPARATAAAHDVGVVVLSQPVHLAQYGELPAPGAANQLVPDSSTLIAVGYGVQSFARNTNPEDGTYGSRAAAELTLAAAPNQVAAGVLAVAPGPGPESGDVCYGDSGGPIFIGGTTTIVAVVSGGTNDRCQGPSLAARIDTQEVLGFINSFIKTTPNNQSAGQSPIQPVQPTFGPGTTVVVTADNLHLRAGPGTDTAVVAELPRGTTLVITGDAVQGSDYTWWPVRNPDDPSETGYVAAPYITPQS